MHLSRVFRRWVGEGIGDYIHRLRIRAACEQMLLPDLPISEISLATALPTKATSPVLSTASPACPPQSSAPSYPGQRA